METLVVPPPVRSNLGLEGSEGLSQMFTAYHQLATDRYERQLTEAIAGLRLDLHQGLAAVRLEVERTRTDVIKWNLLFWIGQFAAVLGALSFLLQRQ